MLVYKIIYVALVFQAGMRMGMARAYSQFFQGMRRGWLEHILNFFRGRRVEDCNNIVFQGTTIIYITSYTIQYYAELLHLSILKKLEQFKKRPSDISLLLAKQEQNAL